MPMCGWCGAIVSAAQVTDLQNGPTVLRLCPQCVHSEQGQKLAGGLPKHTPRVEYVDPDDEPRPPSRMWVATAVFVLLALFLIPMALAVWQHLAG